jgi:hypothetical protein
VKRGERSARLLCPSAQPDWDDAVAIGVIGGSVDEPRVLPLVPSVPVSDEILELAKPVRPTEVFRFAAPCLCNGCQHYNGSKCGLATKIVRFVPSATDELPECDIRQSCRWFAQEGGEACRRCPRIVTDDVLRSASVRRAADPATPVPNARE